MMTANDTTKKPAAPPPHVFTVENPEYPMLMYNQKTRATKSATDKESQQKLEKDGFGLDPLPPLDPNALTQAEVQEFQGLLAKVSKYVATLPTTPDPNAPAKQTDSKHNETPKHNDVHHRA